MPSKTKNKFFLVVVLTIGLVIGGINLISASSSEAKELTNRKIVVFNKNLDETKRGALLAKFKILSFKNLDLINAKVMMLSAQMEKDLLDQPEVLRIDEDVVVEALFLNKILARLAPAPTPVVSTQVLPWGVDRIDADLVWKTTTGDPIRVAVLDTGIDTAHPDLKDNLKGGINTIALIKGYNDDNGHGTHVAGIIAALNNTVGVVGVGPKIDLYAIKALDGQGSGYLSDIIEGLDWAIQNKMQVVNMSLGTTVDVLSFKEAVQRANAAGIVQVVAAGNNGGAVNYPAAYSEVIAVSAIDKTNTIASWSSRGVEVDLAAPGVDIYSTYKGKIYKTLSGTSMAAPHVSGVVALLLSVPQKCDTDLNGVCSPAEIQQRLKATAKDLGAVGSDNLYGAGLVDAGKAVLQ